MRKKAKLCGKLCARGKECVCEGERKVCEGERIVYNFMESTEISDRLILIVESGRGGCSAMSTIP